MAFSNNYKCETASLGSLRISVVGEVEPLCNSCANSDCENPIEEVTVSVFGIPKKYKVYTGGLEHRAVVRCEGYMSKQDKKEAEKLLFNDDEEDNGGE